MLPESPYGFVCGETVCSACSVRGVLMIKAKEYAFRREKINSAPKGSTNVLYTA